MSRESIAAALHAAPTATPHVYRCTRCGARDGWGPGWLWYGDYIRGASQILCPRCAEPHQHEVIKP